MENIQLNAIIVTKWVTSHHQRKMEATKMQI